MAIRIVTHDTHDDALQLYKIPEAMKVLSMSRSVIYDVMKSGRLRWVKEKGCGRLIPATAIVEYVALLEREAAAFVDVDQADEDGAT